MCLGLVLGSALGLSLWFLFKVSDEALGFLMIIGLIL